MAAPKGNQFWKLRSKHGRNAIFKSPEILKEACYEYFEATSKRVWAKKDWVGKDAFEVEREIAVPFTLQGLFIFLGISKNVWYALKEKEDFKEIVTHIEDIIFTQKFEGASIGAYNANIIARELGLTDKKDVNVTAEQPLFNLDDTQK